MESKSHSDRCRFIRISWTESDLSYETISESLLRNSRKDTTFFSLLSIAFGSYLDSLSASYEPFLHLSDYVRFILDWNILQIELFPLDSRVKLYFRPFVYDSFSSSRS